MKNKFDINDVESLQQRFPYMFDGPVIYLSFFKGWFPDFVQLCFELDALLGDERHRFHWVQLKGKFGGYRMYFDFRLTPGADDSDGDDDGESDEDNQCSDEPVELTRLKDLRAQIHATVQRYADVMNAKCCVCGDLGAKISDTGWINTLCEFHSTVAREGRGDFRPLYEVAAVPKWPGEDAGGGAS